MLVRYVLNVEPLWNNGISFDPALALLPESVHERITRFHFLTDRKLALGSALLQRIVILQHHGALPSLRSVVLSRDPKSGRPYYEYPASPAAVSSTRVHDFNTTHHNPRSPGEKEIVALAARLSPGRIGIDITPTLHERGDTRKFVDTFKDADVFTSAEWAKISSYDKYSDRARSLYLHWALKEAYVKAVGTGLVTDLTAVEWRGVELFDLEKEKKWLGARVWVNGDERKDWWSEVSFWDGTKQNGEGFYLALVTDREGLDLEDEEADNVRFVELDFQSDIASPWGRDEDNKL